MTRSFFPALIALAATLPPAADAAFKAATARYQDGSAHAAAFTQVYTPAGFTAAKRESGTIWIQAPQRLRFDYTSPEKKVFTYDAGEGRLLSPEDRQLTVQRVSPEERARLPIVFLSDSAELSREYEISAEAADSATRVLLKPRTPRPELGWLRLAIQKDGAISELSYEDASGNRTEFRFESWRREKPRPPEDYRIVAPPGTRIIQN